MSIRRGRRVAPARIRALLEDLLEASTLCAIATVSGSSAHVNTAYFAWGGDFRVIWLSDRDAAHSRNLRRNPSAAIAVFDSTQLWGDEDRGLQLFGRARELAGSRADAARQLYAGRFRRAEGHASRAYACYELRPRRAKLFDERELGAGVFVIARIRAGGAVSWEQTDVYTAAA
jgi:uncharacterized protein YhbP (UPF0306 family)